jgi:hypothetical protein
MNASELAAKMLDWENLKRTLDGLADEIEAEVLKIGKTQVVGSVRVTYSGGRATYDYETPGKNAPAELIEEHSEEHEVVDWDAIADEVPEVVAKHTAVRVSVDWSAVCEEAKIKPIVVSRTEPKATIKLEG